MLDFILTVVGYGILALLGLALFFAWASGALVSKPNAATRVIKDWRCIVFPFVCGSLHSVVELRS